MCAHKGRKAVSWFNRVLVLGVVVLGWAALPVRADTIYTYTGNPFTLVGSNYPGTTANFITITFSVAQPLAPNSSFSQNGSSGPLLSLTITDGIYTFGLAPNTLWDVVTNAQGQIVQWDIADVTAGQFPSIGSINTIFAVQDNSNQSSLDFGVVNNSPGTWTTSTSTVPEPGSLLLLSVGLLGLVGAATITARWSKSAG